MHFKTWNKGEPYDLKMQIRKPFKQKVKIRIPMVMDERSKVGKGIKRIRKMVMTVEKEDKVPIVKEFTH